MSRTNPFPGMNPYMEQTWADAHHTLIGYIRDALDSELPEDLVAKTEEQVDVLAPSGEKGRGTRPDISIIETTENWERGLPPVWTPGPETGAVAVTEPELLVVE